MPLNKSKSNKAFNENVKTLMHEVGKSPHVQSRKQALAIAYATKRGEAKGGAVPERAMGGLAPMMAQAYNPVMPGSPAGGVVPRQSMPMTPVAASAPLSRPLAKGGAAKGDFKHDGKLTTGPLVSHVPGRTDLHFTHVPSGSYVIPADIVSAHGEGNTLAGMKALNSFFKLGEKPHPNPASSIYHPKKMMAKGGKAHSHVGRPVPVKLAGGEIVVPPENVHETMERVFKKKMSLDEAHRKMDSWVVGERKKLRKTLSKLPGPATD